MSFSNYLETNLLDHIFGTDSWSKPSEIAICALTTNAIDGDTGQFSTGTGVEVADSNAYARVQLDASDSNWTVTTGQVVNAVDITFPQATGSWGTVVAIAVTDDATHDSGNLLAYAALDTSKTIDDGDVLQVPAGSLVITLD
ncbi:hypothetical protein GC163_13300 [bacterium]|nr:hypothetical protein [bacterium]